MEDYALHGGGLSPAIQLEAIKSAVLLSDLYRERAHFDWLLRLLLLASSPSAATSESTEDPALAGWVFIGLCKVRQGQERRGAGATCEETKKGGGWVAGCMRRIEVHMQG